MTSSCRKDRRSGTKAQQFPNADIAHQASAASSSRRVQVLIVGLGPAGTACGLALANSGVDVLAVDRAYFPRDKICGDALTGEALAYLHRHNVPSRIIQRSFGETRKPCFQELTPTLAEAGGYSLIGMGLRTQTASFHTIRRIDLDNWLVECCAKADVPMQFGWQVQALHRVSASEPWTVQGTIRSRNGQLQGQFQISAEVVVGCDGVSSVIQHLSRDPRAERPIALASRRYCKNDEIEDAVEDEDISLMDHQWALNPSYAWQFSVTGGTNAGIYWCHHRNIPRISGRDLLALTHQHAPRGDAIKTWGIPVLTEQPLAHAPSGILLTGDAASLVDPLIGHGIDRAIVSGELAGQVLAQGFQTGCNIETITRTYENKLEIRRRGWQQHIQQLENALQGKDHTADQCSKALLRRAVWRRSSAKP